MRNSVRAALTVAALSIILIAQNPADDIVLRAMKDELERSRTLRVAGLEEKPYYIEYSIEDTETFTASASLGALVNATHGRARIPVVQVRVGNYDFDNTNHVSSQFYSGARFDPEQFPLDNNYATLRHNLWLATDRLYKTALEAIARKRASLKNATDIERLPDFYKAPAAVSVQAVKHTPVDEAAWKKRAVALSSAYSAYPEVYTSGVEFSNYAGTSYFVNSEGSVQRLADDFVSFRGQAYGQAADGMAVRDGVFFQSLDPAGLPGDAEIRKAIVQSCENVKALLKAPMGEDYSGPVLFEAQAAAQVLAQLIGDNIRLVRRPLTDPGRPLPNTSTELDSKLNSRILPDWIDIVDDATQQSWRGRNLFGHYQFDMEGIAPKPLQIVEKGVLKNFLLTRTPVKGFDASNGHARLGGNFGGRAAAISNLFVKASQTKTPAELKQQLIQMCKQRDKPFGVLVRKLDYPSVGSVADLGTIASNNRGAGTRPISPPILVYRVYPDGREELVRGLRFRGLNVRALRDLVAASDENFLFDFINNGAPFALAGLGGYLAPASVIAPSLLFEEVEFERPRDELSKPPLVPPPPLETTR